MLLALKESTKVAALFSDVIKSLQKCFSFQYVKKINRKVSNIGALKNNSSVGRRFLLERIILRSGQRVL